MEKNRFYEKLKNKLAVYSPVIQNEADYLVSAVVVPLVEQGGELGVLFEVRSSQLSWQPGEICFPGGRMEPEDAGPEATAVRETCEELGLTADELLLMGPLDYLVSPIGISLHPFVGYIADIGKIMPSSDEVAEIFFVPLEFLLGCEPLFAEMEVATRPLPGFPFELLPEYSSDWRRRRTYPVLFYQYKDRVIWGLTARVLFNFIAICRELD